MSLKDLPSNNKVITVTHSLNSLNNFAFIVLNHLDALEVLYLFSIRACIATRGQTYNSEVKAPFGEIGRVGLSRLIQYLAHTSITHINCLR